MFDIYIIIGPRREKTCLQWFAKQHKRRLISAFVIRILESIICKLATDELSIF